jgi:hypothetical protein
LINRSETVLGGGKLDKALKIGRKTILSGGAGVEKFDKSLKIGSKRGRKTRSNTQNRQRNCKSGLKKMKTH